MHTLQEEHYVTISSIDAETGAPSVNAISWIYADSGKLLRMAVDPRSSLVKNIKKNPLVAVTLIAGGSTYAVNGKAEVSAARMNEVPLKLSKIELQVHEVRDVMFYGARLTAEPKFEKTYDQEAAEKLDQQVMDALKQ